MHKLKIKFMFATLAIAGMVTITGCGKNDNKELEKVTEATTENITEAPTTEVATEAPTEKTTEKTTEKETETPTELKTEAPTETTVAEVVTKEPTGAFAKIEFGTFRGEKIEWIVLAEEDGKKLILTANPIDSRDYNATRSNVAWETSLLREWLNNEFYNTAFTDDEKSKIINSTMPDEQTNDNVFCLSREEARKYFTDDESRKCIYKSEVSYWWLRTSTDNGTGSAYVDQDGIVRERFSVVNYYTTGGLYHDHYGGTRPAMWIKQ